MWKNWIVGILGLVILVVAFTPIDGSTLQWTLGIVGACVAALGFWSASVEQV